MTMDYEKKYKEVFKKAKIELQAYGSKDCGAARQKWTDDDKEQCDLLIEQLSTLKRTLALDFRNEIKWLKSLKQRMEER